MKNLDELVRVLESTPNYHSNAQYNRELAKLGTLEQLLRKAMGSRKPSPEVREELFRMIERRGLGPNSTAHKHNQLRAMQILDMVCPVQPTSPEKKESVLWYLWDHDWVTTTN